MLMLARGLGRINYFSEPEAQALLDLKGKWGYKDPRAAMNNCELCANDVSRESWPQSGVQQTAFSPPKYCAEQASSNAGAAGRLARRTGSPDPGDYRPRDRGTGRAEKLSPESPPFPPGES